MHPSLILFAIATIALLAAWYEACCQREDAEDSLAADAAEHGLRPPFSDCDALPDASDLGLEGWDELAYNNRRDLVIETGREYMAARADLNRFVLEIRAVRTATSAADLRAKLATIKESA